MSRGSALAQSSGPSSGLSTAIQGNDFGHLAAADAPGFPCRGAQLRCGGHQRPLHGPQVHGLPAEKSRCSQPTNFNEAGDSRKETNQWMEYMGHSLPVAPFRVPRLRPSAFGLRPCGSDLGAGNKADDLLSLAFLSEHKGQKGIKMK